MPRNYSELDKVKDILINMGEVSFNPFDFGLRKLNGYIISLDFYFEDLIDITTFEKVFEEVQSNIADLRAEYSGNYDFEKALFVDINASDSFYQVTCDLYFSNIEETMNVCNELGIDESEIFDLEYECYWTDNIDEDEEDSD